MIRILDIARQAGVSTSTVSRVVNGKECITPHSSISIMFYQFRQSEKGERAVYINFLATILIFQAGNGDYPSLEAIV
jgi:DNA-directed RNA polymerase specialized sigma54-like protein